MSGIRRIVRHGLPMSGLALVAALAAACGGNGSPGSAGTTAQAPPAATGASQPAGTPVTATLSDFHIALSSQSFFPGTYTFHAVNTGRTVHSLEINGPGVSDKALSSDLNAGQSGDLTVTLQAGAYDIFCPVDSHKNMGMDLTITVAGTAAGGGGASVTPMPATTQGGGY